MSVKTIMTVLALAMSTTVSQPASPQLSADKLEITAFAVNMSNIGTGATAIVDITINSWSSDAERERLITTMIEKGPDALLRELQKTPSHGRFRIPALRGPDPSHLRLGQDLHYTWQTPLPEGGRRIVIATDRYIGFREATNRPRTIDYPFTLMEIRVTKEGEGEGKMSIATKISFDKDKKVMELENYASEPVRLQNVRVKAKT